MKTTLELPPGIIPEGSILSGFRGSISHNTYKPAKEADSIDDVDLISVYIAPVNYYIGLNQDLAYKRGHHTLQNEFDLVSYELRHFVILALRFNPNIIPLLWLDKAHYINIEPAGRVFLNNRECFSSKRAYKAFTGYANDQLTKMSKSTFKGYMGIKRKTLVKKFGYDCKNASHAIRLFKMGTEFLETGKLNVLRGEDRNLLIAIKEGKWKLDEVRNYAADLYEESKKALEKSNLPEEPDYEEINKLFMEIISDYTYEKYHVPQALARY